MAAKSNLTNVVILVMLFAVFASALMYSSEITGAATTTGTQLLVKSFVNRPISPKVGDTVTFSITVKNYGGGSVATTIDLSINGQLIKSAPLDALERDGAGVVKVTWVAPAKGTYVATAYVKPVRSETIVSDNTAKLTFTVV